MKRVWFAAAAVAALSLSAFGAQAHEDHLCLDDACTTQALFAPACEGAAGDLTSLDSPRYGAWGFDGSGMDTSVKPGDDFYKFANGAWEARTVIPTDRTRYGNFDKLSELSEARTRAIIEAAAANKAVAGDSAKVGAAYRAFMDEAAIEALDKLSAYQEQVARASYDDEVRTHATGTILFLLIIGGGLAGAGVFACSLPGPSLNRSRPRSILPKPSPTAT